MDPIAHTFVGAALAQTGLRERSSYATAVLVIGANLPDIDGVAMLLGGDRALLLRRGWTHGIPALAILPLLLTVGVLCWNRFFRRTEPPISIAALLGMSYFSVLTHPTLDWMNNYGMRWLMPLDGTWFYGDTLFIVDIWIWTALGGVLFLFHSRRLVSVALWLTFVVLAAALTLRVVPGLMPAKTLWAGAVVVLVVMRWRGIGGDAPSARMLSRVALASVCVYIAVLHASTRYARMRVADEMSTRDVVVETVMIGPMPITPFTRDVLVQSPDGYRYGQLNLWPRWRLTIAESVLPRLANSPIVRRATASPDAAGFMNWARFPFAEVERSGDGFVVYLLDARYTRARSTGFGTARVFVDDDVDASP